MSALRKTYSLSATQLLKRISLLLIALLMCACREQIIHDLEEPEANKYLTHLVDGGIGAEKVKQADGKWSISVDQPQALHAIKYLSDARMFRDAPREMPDNSSIISSREEQRFRFERSMSRELENTLAGLPGVLQARVHLNIPSVDPLLGSRYTNVKGSGSVLLIVSGVFAADLGEVAQLVAGAAGIEKASISVLLSREIPNPESVSKQDLPSVNSALAPVNAAGDASREKIAAFASQPLILTSLASIFFILGLGLLLSAKNLRAKTDRYQHLKKEDFNDLAADFH